MKEYVQFSLKMDEKQLLLSEILPEEVEAFWWDEAHAYGIVQKNQQSIITTFLSNLFKIQNLPFTISFEAIEKKDWLQENQNQLPPIDIGPFFIYGPHYEGNLPNGGIPAVLIDSPHAFGSGHHPTTLSCLEALHQISYENILSPERILDLGCGSGILAMAAFLLWRVPTDAVDLDPVAIAATKRNIASNKLEQISVYEKIESGSHYDLILANIHSKTLISLAKTIKDHLNNNGILILSGILQTQEEEVLEAYAECQLSPLFTIQKGEWSTLCFHQ